MNPGNGITDPVEAAIGAVEKAAVRMLQLRVTIASTGRPAMLAIPADASDAELAELAGWLLTQVMGSLRTERKKAAPRIAIAHSLPQGKLPTPMPGGGEERPQPRLPMYRKMPWGGWLPDRPPLRDQAAPAVRKPSAQRRRLPAAPGR